MKIFSAQLKGTTTVVSGSSASITGSFTGSIAGIDINATNTFTASTIARLSSIETISSSNDSRVNSLEAFSSSIFTTNTFTSSTSARLNSIETISASNISRLSSLETTSASVDTLNTTQNSRLSSLESITGSLATTGSNTFIGTQTITGSLYISSDLIVQGSSSLQNITASAVSIGTNIVNLNTANPAIRYAGLSIGDSGSIGSSGSFLYDSVQDEFIFVHRGANTTVTSSVVLMGPQTYDSIGNETYLTSNRIPKGAGNEHLADSNISDTGTLVTINSVTSSFSGLVGIGITNPSFRLHVLGSSQVISYFQTSGTFAPISWTGDNGTTKGGVIAHNGNISIGGLNASGTGINGDSSLTIKSGSGFVGINTNSVNVPLVVSTPGNTTDGTFYSTVTINNTGTSTFSRVRFDRGGVARWGLTLLENDAFAISNLYENNSVTANDSTFVIRNSGNIGMGIASPSANLHIASGTNTSLRINATAANGSAELDLLSNGTQNSYIDFGPNDIRFRSTNSDMSALNDSAVLSLTNGGRVGIGTTNPINALHIRGVFGSPSTTGNSQNGILRIGQKSGNGSLDIGFGDPFSWLQSRDASDYSTNYYLSLNPNGGNVGIGITSPIHKLSVNGNAKFVITPGGGGDSDRVTIAQNNGTYGIDLVAYGSGGQAYSSTQGMFSWGGYDALIMANNANIKFVTASYTERMRITNAGQVLMYNQPAFYAYGNTGNTGSNEYLIYPTVHVNRGGHYNASNGVFTAPVAGLYFFSWSAIGNQANDVYRFFIRVNNVNWAGDHQLRQDTNETGTSAYATNGNRSVMINLSANDTVRIYFTSDAGSIFYGANSTSDNYLNFFGYLIG
jgi:hypothetical protein